jgi:predicted CoA-binding protein
MQALPPSVADFLAGKRIVVAGVSRTGRAPANAIFRRLRQCGHEAIPVNPNASELEGARSYPSVSAVPGEVHGVLIAAHPSVGAAIVREAAARGIRRV